MWHIRQLTTVGAEPSDVLERWSSLDGIRSWWTEDVTGGAAVGDEFSLGFGRPERVVVRVAAIEPDRVEWVPTPATGGEWVGTRVVCSVARHDDPLPWQTAGTAVRLEHIDWPEFTDFAAHCNTTWARLLLGFKHMCERGGVSPERFVHPRSTSRQAP